jgi:DNA-binding MarR family transcriptional regulator
MGVDTQDLESYDLVMLINRVAALLHRNIDFKLKPYGLARTQYLILIYLCHSEIGSLPTSELVAKVMVEPATISGIIDVLENKGLVKRVSQPEDKRRKDVQITQAGRELFYKIPMPRLAMEKVLRRSIDPNEIQTALLVGEKMLVNLEEELQKEVGK